MITAVLIGAGQRGADAYASYALTNPDKIKFVAVADPSRERREKFANLHKISPDMRFENDIQLFEQGKLADCVLVCTQDRYHTEPVTKALELGYHVMCEKPMSFNALDCVKMSEFAERYDRTLTICHVLRYSPFFTELKKILDSGVIGDVISIQHIECVGYWHQAHSFVRGNWRNSDLSTPMILQKCCHDMDILRWLLGKKCLKVSSFGSLQYFKEENAPKGSSERCLIDCKVEEECPYSAKKIYMNEDTWYSDLLRKVVSVENTDEAVEKELLTGPYGRCVFRCDNNVVDHQVVNMEYEGGTTVSLTMSAFTSNGSRIMNIMGTKGQIRCDMENNVITTDEFLNAKSETITLDVSVEGHSGSDRCFMEGFVKTVESQGEYSLSSAKESLESHLVAFAAEKSRLNDSVVDMKEFEKELSAQLS